ncbi:hypothetical protein [Paenibacillus sp. FSL L8-0708]|uniref:hypothetical protein n=1 Tax=Paenibacillus sp. FSL L8-0708 TaxID=2975311 RepID=UPI0030FC74E6
MTQRDWQKDMDLCKQLNEWYEHDWEAGQEEGSRIIRIYETVPDEPFNFVAECENDLTTTFIMESRTALPYWLQEAKERGEREFRMQKVLYNIAMESNDEQTRRQAKHILSVLYPDTPAPTITEDNESETISRKPFFTGYKPQFVGSRKKETSAEKSLRFDMERLVKEHEDATRNSKGAPAPKEGNS